MRQDDWNNPDWLHVGEIDPGEQRSPRRSRSARSYSVMLVLGGFVVGCAAQPLLGNLRPVSDAERAFRQVYQRMEQGWLYRDETENYADYLWEAAMAGMATYSSDPYTAYRSPIQAEQRMNQLANTEAGVGVQVIYHPTDGGFYVARIVEGSGAEAAGVLPHDKLIGVNGQSTKGLVMNDLIGLMSGADDSTVQLTFERAGEELPPLEVVRTTEAKRTASSRIEGDVGILSITTFAGTTGKDVEHELARLEAQGIEQLVIDLRGNGGGLLTACTEVATHLTEGRNVLLYEENNRGERTPGAYTDPNAPTYRFESIALLVDKSTASASEVLALYLRDILGATIVGEQTFGKGVVQNTYPLANGGSLTMTELRWTGPNGDSVQGVGITPDIEVSTAGARLGALPRLAPGESYGMGSENEVCAVVQETLQLLGYDAGEADGRFGLRTQLALLAYQHDSAVLEEDGRITPDLLLHLYIDASNHLRENAMQLDEPLIRAVKAARAAQPGA